MLEYWNLGRMDTNANPTVAFSASNIALILDCIFSGTQKQPLWHVVIIPILHQSIIPWAEVIKKLATPNGV